MSKKALKVLGFITLFLSIIAIKFTTIISSLAKVPDSNNTTVLYLTFVSLDKSMAGTYNVYVKEYDGSLQIHTKTIVDVDALLNMQLGDSITVRVFTDRLDSLKGGMATAVEMNSSYQSIVSLDKSAKYWGDLRRSIMPVAIALPCILFAVSASSFCALIVKYKRNRQNTPQT